MWRRLQGLAERWEALGADPELVQALRHGVVPELDRTPQPYDFGGLWLDGEQLPSWEALRDHYLSIEAIKVVDSLDWCNFAFLVPKQSGVYRLAVDCRPCNSCGPEYPTVYDHLYTLREAIQPHDSMSTFDLADGYFHMFIHPDYQKYFGFKVQGVCYQMVALPFGWSGSPAWFMRLSRQIGAWLADPPALPVEGGMVSSAPIRHRIFLDDFLLLFAPGTNGPGGVAYAKALLTYLGLKANEKKSSWELETRKLHLGLWVDTASGVFSIPDDRISKIKACARAVLSEVSRSARWVPARLVARLAGLSVCVSLAFSGAKFFARELYAALKGKGSWADKVKLSNQAVRDVKLLAAFPRRWNGSCIWPPTASRVVITDASDEGWGAIVQAGSQVLQRQGRWTPGMRRKHIMVRELAAVRLALRAARPLLEQQVVECVIDNSAAYYGIKHWASASIDLMRVLRKIFWLCDRQHITLLPRLVKSEANPADSLSRFKSDAEWLLDARVFRQLEAWYGPHSVDLFAAADNAKLPRFYSMLGSDGALGANALQQSWEGENAYCAPPWAYIGRVLKKLHCMRHVACTLLVPDFPSSAWYPVLLSRAKSVRCLPLGAMFRRGTRGLIRAKWPLLAVRLEG